MSTSALTSLQALYIDRCIGFSEGDDDRPGQAGETPPGLQLLHFPHHARCEDQEIQVRCHDGPGHRSLHKLSPDSSHPRDRTTFSGMQKKFRRLVNNVRICPKLSEFCPNLLLIGSTKDAVRWNTDSCVKELVFGWVLWWCGVKSIFTAIFLLSSGAAVIRRLICRYPANKAVISAQSSGHSLHFRPGSPVVLSILSVDTY